jgi:hypothetical protein
MSMVGKAKSINANKYLYWVKFDIRTKVWYNNSDS